MSRRHGIGLKVLMAVAVGGLLVYALYSYHDIHTRLKRSEEKGDRLHQQHDSLSAQLQVVYEHKSRLEKSLQQEKSDHRKNRAEQLQQQSHVESKYQEEKQELVNRIRSINQEHKMLKTQHEDLETEYTKITEQKTKVEEDHRKLTEQHNIEFQQLQQEKNNDIATLRDRIANLQRKSDDLEKQLAVAIQNYQMNQDEVLTYQQKMYTINQQLSQFQAEIDRQKTLINQQRLQNQELQQQHSAMQQQRQLEQHQLQQLKEQQNQLENQQHQRDQQQHQVKQNENPVGQHLPVGQQQQHQYELRQQQQHQQQQHQQQQVMQEFHPNQPQTGNREVMQQPIHQEYAQQQQLQLQQNNLGQPQGHDLLPRQPAGQGQVVNQKLGLIQNKEQEVEQLQMQIRQPGEHEHPGYHQVKPLEGHEAGGQGHGQHKHDTRIDAHDAPAELDGEHKDVQLQQVQPPNMSPEKNETISRNDTQIGQGFIRRLRNGLVQSTDLVQEHQPRQQQIKMAGHGAKTGRRDAQGGRALAINAPEGAKAGQRVENKQMGAVPVRRGKISQSQKDDSNKAKQDDQDTDQNEPLAVGQHRGGHFQMRDPQVDRDRLNAVNLHEGEYRGPIDGKGMEKDQVHAPMQPNALPQPDGQLQGPILDQQVHNEGGQMERPNLVPPMVNNMNQEDQVPVPKAPRLKDTDLLQKGHQVNDDDDYDTDNRNDNVDQQDDQDDDDKDDDNNYGNIKK